ncbi:MAG: 16S rRNA (cytosine(1402)-N(4))-methyltransferase RsmH [Flavobacteriaceae bacterium]
MEYHSAVMLKETVDGLDIKPDGVYVDVTFGGGGHSREILSRLGPDGLLFAFDQDPDAQANIIEDERFTLIAQNFRYMARYLKFYGVMEVDGVLGDFGVSSHQFDQADRGFSTRFDAGLDMRMDQTSKLSAYEVINHYDEAELARCLFYYGELRNANQMAAAITAARVDGGIKTSFQLKEVLASFLPAAKQHKILAQIFQAIRIEVNQEIEVLKEFLMQVPEVLVLGGRLSVLSYHSLEDRLVKRFIRDGVFEGEAERDFFGNKFVPMKKVGKMMTPSKEEIKQNNRARSAKLRVAEKL